MAGVAGRPSPSRPLLAACITRIPTHKLASHMHTFFFFFFFFLFAAGLFDLCVPGLFAVVSVLP